MFAYPVSSGLGVCPIYISNPFGVEHTQGTMCAFPPGHKQVAAFLLFCGTKRRPADSFIFSIVIRDCLCRAFFPVTRVRCKGSRKCMNISSLTHLCCASLDPCSILSQITSFLFLTLLFYPPFFLPLLFNFLLVLLHNH